MEIKVCENSVSTPVVPVLLLITKLTQISIFSTVLICLIYFSKGVGKNVWFHFL